MDDPMRSTSKPAKRAACDRCHVLKSRCSRSAGKDEICDRCRRLGIDCVSSAPLRTGRPRGSGIGLTPGSERRGSNIPSITSFRKSRTPDASSWTNSSQHNSPDTQQSMSLHDQQQTIDLGTSYASMNFSAFTTAPQNIVDSDFSSHDGSMFSEGSVSPWVFRRLADNFHTESYYDMNSFTPMTTRSEDFAIEQGSLAFPDSSWQSLSSSTPDLTSQTGSRSGSMHNAARGHGLSQEPSSYSRLPDTAFGDHTSNHYVGGAFSEHKFMPGQTANAGAFGFSIARLASVCSEVVRLHSGAAMSTTDPLLVVEDTFNAARKLINTLAPLSDNIHQTSSQTDYMSISNWMDVGANAPASDRTSFPEDSKADTRRPVFMQIASTYMCLIQIFHPAIAYLEHRLRAVTISEGTKVPTQLWMPHISAANQSSLFPDTDSRSVLSSSNGAIRARLLLRIMLDILQQLHHIVHTGISLFERPTSEQFSVPLPTGLHSFSSQQHSQVTLGQLLNEERGILTTLQSMLNHV